jgi:hypothetical protein
LGLSREYLIKGIDNPIVKAYHSYQVDMAVLYGAERSRAEKEMREVLDLEFALANVSDFKFRFELLLILMGFRFHCQMKSEEMRRLCTIQSPSRSCRRNIRTTTG